MYCFRCAYALDGLEADRCPECGRVFDADDAMTFDAVPGFRSRDLHAKGFEWGMILSAAMPMVANGVAYGALLIARVSLGYWPQRTWMDLDHIAGLHWLGETAKILFIVSIPATLVTAVCGLFLIACRVWKRAARGWGIALVLWGIGSWLLWYDPNWVWSWVFD